MCVCVSVCVYIIYERLIRSLAVNNEAKVLTSPGPMTYTRLVKMAKNGIIVIYDNIAASFVTHTHTNRQTHTHM